MSNPSFHDIISSIPDRFRPEKAADYSTIVHFDISGEGGGQYTVEIDNGNCRLAEGLQGTPKCVVKTKASTYVKLERGKINAQFAFMTGKVKISNISEMIRFTKLFRKYQAKGNQAEKQLAKAENRKPQHGPLKGLRVLDFTRLLPGPMATMLMADMGAEVIKIEDPDSPDYIRSFTPELDGESAYYLSLNRSKKSLAVNYNQAKGREIIYELAKTADIFIEQFRPGVMEQLGLGYADIQEASPNIIYVSITGFGQDGPYAKKAGHDLNYIGYSGLLGSTGAKGGEPIIPGGQVADIAGGGYMAVNACLAALYARERTGEGQHVDVSMLDCVMPINALQVAQYYAEQKNPDRGTMALSGGLANYNVYECADGKYLALGTLEPKFWDRFCDAVDKPEWKQRIMDTGEKMEQLKEEVATLIRSKTQREWLTLTEPLDNCISPVLEIADLENDPHIQQRNMIVDSGTHLSLKSVGVPLKFSKTKPQIAWASPALGQDTLAILQELQYSQEAIQALRKEGTVAVG